MIEKISLEIAIRQLKRLLSGNSGIQASKDIVDFIERLYLPDFIRDRVLARIMPMGIESPDGPGWASLTPKEAISRAIDEIESNKELFFSRAPEREV